MDEQPYFVYIEDDKLSCEIMLILMVEVLGYSHLAIFHDTDRIIEKLNTLPAPPSLIFLDINIGPNDGYRTLAMIRADERYRETKVIATTASITPETQIRLRESGFNGMIEKPIDQQDFTQRLSLIFRGEPVWD
jgi:CheY-like chemotaxis protein